MRCRARPRHPAHTPTSGTRTIWKQASAAPRAPHAMPYLLPVPVKVPVAVPGKPNGASPYRALFRQPKGPLRPSTLGSKFSAGTKTSSIIMLPCRPPHMIAHAHRSAQAGLSVRATGSHRHAGTKGEVPLNLGGGQPWHALRRNHGGRHPGATQTTTAHRVRVPG
jgi:hypothetical protein